MTTLKEISRQTGVSVNAVSRILNGRNKENRPSSVKRAALVRKAAEELGYRPNEAARAMKTGQFKSVMLLKSRANDYHPISDRAIFAMQELLAPLDHRLILTMPDTDREGDEELTATIRRHCVDGVLAAINRNIPPWLEAVLNDMRVPVVWIGSKREFDSIRHDDYQSGYDGTIRLIQAGHTRIIYADLASCASRRDLWHFSTIDREQGYRDAMAENGLPVQITRPDDRLPENAGINFIRERLLPLKPTAVIAYGLWHTGRAILYACAQENLSIPGDLSLVTWTDKVNTESGMELSGFSSREPEIMTGATRLLLRKIKDNSPQPAIILPFEKCEGQSVAQGC